jgi:hypothetical protein
MVSNVNSTKLTKSTSCQVLRMDDFIRRKKKYNAKTNPIVSRMEEMKHNEYIDNLISDIEEDFKLDDKALIKGSATLYKVYCCQLLREFGYLPMKKLLELFSNLEYAIVRKNSEEIYIEISKDFLNLTYEEAEEEITKARRFVMDKIYSIGNEDNYLFTWRMENMFVLGFEKEVEELNKKYNRVKD